MLHYDGDNDEEAALCFGAGVKLKMNYGLSSGTYLSSHAFTDGFSYGSATLRRGASAWPDHRIEVIENIKAGWLVQIGIYTESYGAGHAVVIDGYRSDGWFHINVGWGGTGNTWYDLPQIDVGGYEFEIIQSLVYDIAPFQGWNQFGADAQKSFRSPYAAPTEAKSKWQVTCPNSHHFVGLVVGTGNKIYATVSPRVGSGSDVASIWIINQYGVKEKELILRDENERVTIPVQNAQGEVFFGTDLGRVYRIDPHTEAVTRIFTEPANEQFFDPPTIDEDGRLYLTTFYKMYCLSRTGTKLWDFTPPNAANIGNGAASVDRGRNHVYLGYFDTVTKVPSLGCINRETGELLFEKVFAADTFFRESSVTITRYGSNCDT